MLEKILNIWETQKNDFRNYSVEYHVVIKKVNLSQITIIKLEFN